MAEGVLAGIPAEVRVAAWALGTMHAALLTLVGVLLFYSGGTLGQDLEGLNTAAGLGLYALLWAISLSATLGSLRRIGHDPYAPAGRVVGAGALWGGFAGAVFLLLLAAVAAFVVLVVAAADGKAADLTLGDLGVVAVAVPAFGVIGGGFAFIGGAIVGTLVTVVDIAVLGMALTLIDGPAPRE